MALIVEEHVKTYDLSQIHLGDLIYAKHVSWSTGVSGFVSAVDKEKILVQYHPSIGNIVNHFFIPVEEVSVGDWEIRWSEDLTVIHDVIIEEIQDDTEAEEKNEP
ncbi:MAG: DUF5026 domain-containing protein [Lachnospiraceae bacterium]